MLSETETSDTGYTSNETPYDISCGTCVDDSENEMESVAPITIQIRNEIDSFSYPIVTQTKSMILPALCFLCVMAMVQLLILYGNITIHDTIIINIRHNPATFDLAFHVTLIIVIVVWVTLLYADYKWSSVPIDVDIDNHSAKRKMKRLNSTIRHIENDIHARVTEIHKLYFDDHELQVWSQQLLQYKKQLEAHQHKSKQKTLKHYIRDIEKQYQDVLHIIDENQFAILSAVLAEMEIGYAHSIRLEEYNHYLRLFNETVSELLDFYGGYHGMKQNQDGTVDVQEFEQLIKKVMDELDESQYTFINY